jgi:rRNA maturation protein Nop10
MLFDVWLENPLPGAILSSVADVRRSPAPGEAAFVARPFAHSSHFCLLVVWDFSATIFDSAPNYNTVARDTIVEEILPQGYAQHVFVEDSGPQGLNDCAFHCVRSLRKVLSADGPWQREEVLRNLEERICRDFPFTFGTQKPHQQTRRTQQNKDVSQSGTEQEFVEESDLEERICRDSPSTFSTQEPHQQTRRTQHKKDAPQMGIEQEIVKEFFTQQPYQQARHHTQNKKDAPQEQEFVKEPDLGERISRDFPFTFGNQNPYQQMRRTQHKKDAPQMGTEQEVVKEIFTQQPYQQARHSTQNKKDTPQPDEQEVVDESDFGAEIGWANILSAAASFERQTTAETPTDTERSRKKKKRSGAKEPYARELE